MIRPAIVSFACLLVSASGCSDSGETASDAGGAPAGEAGGAAGDRASPGGASGAGGAGAGRGGSAGGPAAGAGGTQQAGGGGDAGALPDAGAAGTLTVTSVEPAARSLDAASNAKIAIHFDRELDPASVTPQSLWAFGRWSGPVRDGAYAFSQDGRTVTLTSPRPWTAGDRVTVVLSHALAAADGTTLRAEGFSFHFTTATVASAMTFSEIGRMSTRDDDGNGGRTQAYGGAAADVDRDGFLDLLIVNEISADLRIFMNRGDGTGAFDTFTEDGIVPLGQRASPSDTTDFDGDGIVDLVVANLDANSVSIVLGNGDGTLTKSQDLPVSGEPRGVAVADIDGDGDADVVNTNADGDNMSILVNDGTGQFAEPGDDAFFDAGHGMQIVHREFGLGAGDMDEDGILDMVIGAHGTAMEGSGVVVNRGVGDGSFAFASLQAPETSGWQLAIGDLDGDGHEDVATADGALSNASPDTITILLGDGAGSAAVHQSYTQDIAQPFAIDLGDLDGDMDLDVVVSNYGADWQILENEGDGTIAFAREVSADLAASCAILVDIDNDGDLDAALIDEIEDVLVIMRQQ
jgi:hypothetical protein